jgi:hypothetical protein
MANSSARDCQGNFKKSGTLWALKKRARTTKVPAAKLTMIIQSLAR